MSEETPKEERQQIQEFENLKENLYPAPNNIEVKFINSEVGLGVFATKKIKKNSIIERCPMVSLGWRSKYQGDKQLHRYLYTNGPCQCMECQVHGFQMFMVLGYGMIYNHKDIPNSMWKFNFKNLYADVVAQDNIEKGKQIFVSYGNEYFKDRKQIPMD